MCICRRMKVPMHDRKETHHQNIFEWTQEPIFYYHLPPCLHLSFLKNCTPLANYGASFLCFFCYLQINITWVLPATFGHLPDFVSRMKLARYSAVSTSGLTSKPCFCISDTSSSCVILISAPPFRSNKTWLRCSAYASPMRVEHSGLGYEWGADYKNWQVVIHIYK